MNARQQRHQRNGPRRENQLRRRPVSAAVGVTAVVFVGGEEAGLVGPTGVPDGQRELLADPRETPGGETPSLIGRQGRRCLK